MSEEREFAHAEWRQSFFDRTSREPTPSEAWYAALKWQAGRQSAGANETTLRVLSSHAIRKQEAAAWMHKQGDFLEPSLRQLDSGELSRGWTQEPLFYAAPIGDNGAKQADESKRVELTDEEIGHLRLIVAFCETLSSIEIGSYAYDALCALRLFLARASAKGE